MRATALLFDPHPALTIAYKLMNFQITVTGKDFYKFHAQFNSNGQPVFSPQIRLSVQAPLVRFVLLDEILGSEGSVWIRRNRVPFKKDPP